MIQRHPAVLTVTERVVAALIVLNIVYGAGVLVLLVATFVAPSLTVEAIAGKVPPAGGEVGPMRWLMIVGLAAVPLTHLMLTRLRSMVSSVQEGDPFVADNARRLNVLAAGVGGLELLRLAAGFVGSSAALTRLGLHIDRGFAFTPWVAVLLLFVLARVFEEGTRMRADLEGTV